MHAKNLDLESAKSILEINLGVEGKCSKSVELVCFKLFLCIKSIVNKYWRWIFHLASAFTSGHFERCSNWNSNPQQKCLLHFHMAFVSFPKAS